jgi:chromosome partitioning protein
METIAIANQKGGVGKTTVAVLLADALTRAGRRVLLVDLDPQANASRAAGASADGAATIADALGGRRRISDAIRLGALGFDVAVSSTDLAAKERNRTTADEHHLRLLLDQANGYDVALVDCPPSLGVLTVNALTAADRHLIVSDASRFALDGTLGLAETADVVRTYFNPSLVLAGVVLNLVDGTLECRRRTEQLTEHWGDQLLSPRLPRRVVVEEAVAGARSLWSFGSDRGADEVCAPITELATTLEPSRAR